MSVPALTLDLRLRVSLAPTDGPAGPLVQALLDDPKTLRHWLPHAVAVAGVRTPPLREVLGGGEEAYAALTPLLWNLSTADLRALAALDQCEGAALVALLDNLDVTVEQATVVE